MLDTTFAEPLARGQPGVSCPHDDGVHRRMVLARSTAAVTGHQEDGLLAVAVELGQVLDLPIGPEEALHLAGLDAG